jgi:hypothetical protein
MSLELAPSGFPPMENHRDVYLASEVTAVLADRDAWIARLEKELRDNDE